MTGATRTLTSRERKMLAMIQTLTYLLEEQALEAEQNQRGEGQASNEAAVNMTKLRCATEALNKALTREEELKEEVKDLRMRVGIMSACAKAEEEEEKAKRKARKARKADPVSDPAATVLEKQFTKLTEEK